MSQCPNCSKEIELPEKLGFRDDCMHCNVDLHVCRFCIFFDSSAYNECKETQADRVVDKEKANFCDYFRFNSDAQAKSAQQDDIKQKLEDLFKK